MSNNKQKNKKSNSAANAKQKEIDQPNTVEQNQPKEKQTSQKSLKKKSTGQFDVSVITEWISKYKRYIGAVVLFALMVVVLIKTSDRQPQQKPEEVVTEEQDTQDVLTEEFQVDAIPQINDLIKNYYENYSSGNVDQLENFAKPISDTEKSYVALFSQYVESYNDLKCYTKRGLTEGEYVVSVYMNMKFKDIKTAAPGLDFFYVRTDENGDYYIDNAYSQFNQSNMEESTQADVQSLINEFERAEDVTDLMASVQEEYEAAVKKDADLDKMVSTTLPAAISEWAKSLTEAKPQDEQTDEEQKDDSETKLEGNDKEEADKEETNQTDKSDEKADAQTTTKKTRVVYAKDTINLRKKPSTNSSVLKQIAVGTKFKMYTGSDTKGWVKVKVGSKVGYVKKKYLTTQKSKVPDITDQDNDTAISLPEGKKITLSDSVNVRKSMSETAEKVGLAYRGDTVEVIQSYQEGWTKVKWNGEVGYIKTDLIK